MKVYRKDRLYAQDKDKTECLTECLKNVRITDESAYFNSNKPMDHRSGVPSPHSPSVGHRNNVPRSGPGGGGHGHGGGGATTGGGGGGFSGAK